MRDEIWRYDEGLLTHSASYLIEPGSHLRGQRVVEKPFAGQSEPASENGTGIREEYTPFPWGVLLRRKAPAWHLMFLGGNNFTGFV